MLVDAAVMLQLSYRKVRAVCA